MILYYRPGQVKWQLMIASCYRRSGNYQQALETYKKIHKRFPDNVECKNHSFIDFSVKRLYILQFNSPILVRNIVHTFAVLMFFALVSHLSVWQTFFW